MRLALHLFGQFVNLLFGQEGEVLQVFHNVAVVGVRPELVELERCCFVRVEPNRAAGRFAEFRAVGLQHERYGQAECFCFGSFLLPDQIQAACNVAPLVRSADLPHVLMLVQMQVVDRLQDLV